MTTTSETGPPEQRASDPEPTEPQTAGSALPEPAQHQPAQHQPARPEPPGQEPGAPTSNAGPIRNIDLHRAVLAVLLRQSGPLTLDDLVPELDFSEGVAGAALHATSPRRRVSDLLRWQIKAGRVLRVARGVDEVVPGSLSRTTQWRCHNWRLLRERRRYRSRTKW